MTEMAALGESTTYSKRELIVVAAGDGPPGAPMAMMGTAKSVGALLADRGARMEPLFRSSAVATADGAPGVAATPAAAHAGSGRFFHVEAPDEELDDLAAALRETPGVAAAYVKPRGEEPRLNEMAPSGPFMSPGTSTPDFSALQLYRAAAPAGVDVAAAWALPGGRGKGVRIVDLEWNWEFGHEDLQANFGAVVVGTPSSSTDHGTAVVGVMGADRNAFGVVGLCPDAVVSCGAFSVPSAQAIDQAAAVLNAGDLLLLEIHRAGPRHGFEAREDQAGYIAIEWWDDDFIAIQSAVRKGIIVVEAAGNGAENLDDLLYDSPGPGFQPSWRNPFRGARDSGAILVGAGAPPPGTHGQNWGPDRSRLDFSNYGSRVDAQGWGREVTTTGYGDLQSGPRTKWYTNEFAGTSSASPIVTGVLGCLQGIRRAKGKPPLTPAQARAALRKTGSSQRPAPGRPVSQRIGKRPDLAKLIAAYT